MFRDEKNHQLGKNHRWFAAQITMFYLVHGVNLWYVILHVKARLSHVVSVAISANQGPLSYIAIATSKKSRVGLHDTVANSHW